MGDNTEIDHLKETGLAICVLNSPHSDKSVTGCCEYGKTLLGSIRHDEELG
jgi:hypothetical protein